METTINKVEIQGYLGQDAECKLFESGRTLISMRIATNENYKSNTGEWVKNTTWHNVSYWKNKLDTSMETFKKGELVLVVGRLSTKKYKDKNGVERTITEINATKIESIKPKNSK